MVVKPPSATPLSILLTMYLETQTSASSERAGRSLQAELRAEPLAPRRSQHADATFCHTKGTCIMGDHLRDLPSVHPRARRFLRCQRQLGKWTSFGDEKASLTPICRSPTLPCLFSSLSCWTTSPTAPTSSCASGNLYSVIAELTSPDLPPPSDSHYPHPHPLITPYYAPASHSLAFLILGALWVIFLVPETRGKVSCPRLRPTEHVLTLLGHQVARGDGLCLRQWRRQGRLGSHAPHPARVARRGQARHPRRPFDHVGQGAAYGEAGFGVMGDERRLRVD